MNKNAMDRTRAGMLWSALGSLMCHPYDVAVFCDTVPDSRPLLEHMAQCATPVVLQAGALQPDSQVFGWA